eukprot:3939688-Rhodomonas_salina.2
MATTAPICERAGCDDRALQEAFAHCRIKYKEPQFQYKMSQERGAKGSKKGRQVASVSSLPPSGTCLHRLSTDESQYREGPEKVDSGRVFGLSGRNLGTWGAGFLGK